MGLVGPAEGQVHGCWSSVTLVERYAHLLPAGLEADIKAFLNGTPSTVAAANE